MKLDRIQLLNELFAFASQGSGVIVGSPGVGKTHTLKAFCSRLIEENNPCLYLPIDKLDVSTEESFRSELGISEDFISYLESITAISGASKGILVIDAFDAARSETTRGFFLSLIRRVLSKLERSWNVIVSVRTYDANKSEELQELFPNLSLSKPPGEYQRSQIKCRHLYIPLLTGEERVAVVQSIPPLIPIFEQGSGDFLDLLRIMFNIWLLEKILDRNPNLPELSSVSSEVQLLGLFWKQRVAEGNNSADKRLLLSKATRAMVNDRALSVREEEVYNLGGNEAWDFLFSSEIFAHSDSTAQRVAFSHNILFDYAVSVLLMEDEPNLLVDFLNEDLSRPLFLRPSLNYYFTRLWHTRPEIFWTCFWHFLPHEDVHMRLIAQLVPTTVIAKEARSIDQLDSLINALAESKPFAQDAVLRLLRALEAIVVGRDELWILFLEKISEHPHSSFIGLLSWLTSDILNRNAEAQDGDPLVSKCGAIGRQLLGWIWEQRSVKVEGFLDSIGAISLVPIVAKTYKTNVEASRTVLEKVFDLTQESNYPIDYLYRLSHELDKIWISDPDFAARTYNTVFSSYETSKEPTYMGTPVMPLMSNRRQDYEMCRYILIEYFPRFLLSAPQPATNTAINILNQSVLADHVTRYLKESVELHHLVKEFSFRGKQAHYIPDLSYIWGRHHFDDYLKMGNALFEYIAKLTSKDEIESLLDIFRDNAWIAYFWAKLLHIGTQNPKLFAPYLFELCIARPMQTGDDTIYQLGNFLAAAMPEFTEEQQLAIEESVLSIPEDNSDSKDYLEHQRNKLLYTIPMEFLKTDEGKSLRAEMEKSDSPPQNKPLSSLGFSSKPYTEDDWLNEQGADLDKAENKVLRSLYAPLNEFEKTWQNKLPSPEATGAILPAARDLYAALHAEPSADLPVIDSAWTTLAASVEAMSRGINNSDHEEYGFCREVLIRCSQHRLPESDPEADAKFNMPAWSPSPRAEAAQGLPWLAFHAVDKELLQAIEALTQDKSPAVRFLVTGELFRITKKAPEEFWRLANYLAENETNGVVLLGLCNSIGRVIWNNEEPTVKILEKLAPSARTKYQGTELMNYFVSMVMWLVLDRQNEWAVQEAKRYVFNPDEFALPLKHAVFEALQKIKLENIESSDLKEVADRAIDWLMEALPPTATAMKSLLAELEREPSEEKKQTIRNVYGVFDEIVTRLCFSADVIPYLRQEGNTPLSEMERCNYYFKIKPLLKGVLNHTANEKTSLLFAPTAHRFMQLLNGVIACDPKGVLQMAAEVARASESDNFNLDPLAVGEVVKLVEAILADHRDAVTESEPLQDLLNLLDTFAKAGWPAALRLVWRLDEIFR
jgi:DNA polymerase III delta prime subunit